MVGWDEEVWQALQALVPQVEGKPCVNVDPVGGGVYACRRISDLGTDEDTFFGECEWVDPADARPDELTDGMGISCDCVRLGPGWWQDTYFGWYFVHDPALAGRSLAGDHSWAAGFLAAAQPPPSPPAPERRGPAHRLTPPTGCPFLGAEDVRARLRGAFAFFAAFPHGGPGEPHEGPDRTYAVVAAESAEALDYLSFEVRPREGILVRYRDEQHQAAVGPLLERCAGALGYEALQE